MIVKPSDLEAYERSYCDCAKCGAACRSMPGMLAPGDMDRIADFCGEDTDDQNWVTQHFRASEGAMVVTNEGNHCRIPTIVPKQVPGGNCVFLKEGKCSIHPVSPFGCRVFKVCDDDDEQLDNEKSRSALSCIAGNIDYNMMHHQLYSLGYQAPTLAVRKAKMDQLLGEINGTEDES